jgi:hypothetical protein
MRSGKALEQKKDVPQQVIPNSKFWCLITHLHIYDVQKRKSAPTRNSTTRPDVLDLE